MWLREIFEHFGLQSFPKTSGSKGLQIYVPLNTPTSYEATKPFAHALARLLEDQHRDLVVSDMKKELRKGKVLVDWSQNDEHKTTIAIYSLRAREHPTVSTPVKWEEVEHMLKKKDPGLLVFEADQVLKRVEKMGDLFEPVLTLKQTLPKLTTNVGAALDSPGQARPCGERSSRRRSNCAGPGLKIAAQAGRQKKTVKPETRKQQSKNPERYNPGPWRNSTWELQDGRIPAGSRIFIPPSFRRKISCSTTPPGSTRSKSTLLSGN